MGKKIYQKRYNTRVPKLDEKIHDLVESAGGSEDSDLIEEMIVTALRIREDALNRGDIKMMNTAMKELRYALKVFSPFSHIRKVAIFGSARTPRRSPEYVQAKDFAGHMVKYGWMVITGAATGIMNAGNEGAGRKHSFGANIRLPFEQDANPVIADDPKLISFKYFFTRKLIFVKESHATVLCPGGFGTHDESYETLTLIQTGKTDPRPVVCLDPPKSQYWSSWRKFTEDQMIRKGLINPEDIDLIHFSHSAKEAAKYIAHFYSNYHSCRYIDDRLVLRIKKPLPHKALDYLNGRFQDILVKQNIAQQMRPFPEEENEPHTDGLVRLFLYFDRKQYARLKVLIETINDQSK